MYLLYNTWDFRGIYIFTLIMSVLIAIVFFKNLIKKNNGLIVSFICSIIVMKLSKGIFAARNQIFSFLIFELEIYGLNEFLENGKKRYFWFLLVLAVLLLLVHDTVYPLYFMILLPYLGEMILSKIIKLDDNSKLEYSNLSNAKYLIILIILSLIIGLFTPIFGTAYTNLINCMNGYSTEFINELKKVNIFEQYSLTFYTFTTIAILCFTKTRVKVKDLLFVFGLLIFSTMAGRNIFFMYFIGTIFFVNILRNFIDTYLQEDIWSKIDSSKLILTVLSCFVLILSISNFSGKLTNEYVSDLAYPKEVTDWILENVDCDNMRIWTHFNWGSYLELNGIKVFVDSRSGMYTIQENKGCTVLSDWYNTYKGEIPYKDTFEKYEITHVLLGNGEFINKYICDDKEYELIYQDNQFTLYEKKNSN